MRCYLFLSIVLALLLAAGGTGCSGGWSSTVPHDQPASTQAQSDDRDQATGTPPLEPQPEAGTTAVTPTPEATEARLPAGAEALVGLAQEDLARRLDLAPDAIRVVSVEAVVWPDASLRCPKAGTVYGQVITPGFRVVLEAESQMYEYHTDREQTAMFCEEEVSAMEVPPVPGTVEPGQERLVDLVKEDLAQTLSIPVEEVGVLEAKSVVWPDASLGCPQAGLAYAQVVTPGFLVLLKAEDQAYEYHTDQTRALLCAQGKDLNGETSLGFPESDKLPVFVQVIQTYLLSGSTLETPLTNVAPNSVFAFDLASQTLLLRPSIVVFPETQVLIGQTTVIQSPNRTDTMGELFQGPPSNTGFIKVIAVDAETDGLTFTYGDQVFELLPGQSRSFKQTRDQAANVVTIVTNAGRLASIEPLPDGPDAR